LRFVIVENSIRLGPSIKYQPNFRSENILNYFQNIMYEITALLRRRACCKILTIICYMK